MPCGAVGLKQIAYVISLLCVNALRGEFRSIWEGSAELFYADGSSFCVHDNNVIRETTLIGASHPSR